MPHDPEMFPYVIVGDGVIATEKIARSLRSTGKAPYPVPVYNFAQDLKKARELADRMRPWNDMVLICKIEEVVK